ncbi:MAG: restriction endonuclease subunit S [Prevotella sp.]|nr:restriction endonuclease subunit S [Alistipes senegalensis]MCM1357587.1 restriction endonuclease subunit S [Prevotella sp.]MCM1473756.1 restriction endonuclease subunit S [Muribaculaceae bacterium]
MRQMKDSGIEWIGICPYNWSFMKGKYIFTQRSERGNTINLQLLSPTQKFGVIPQSLFEEMATNTAVKVSEKTDLNQFKTIHKGNYCISLRSFQGGFEYSVHEGVVSPAYQVFYPIMEISDRYYKYLFKNQSFIDKMNSYSMSLRDGKNIAFSDFGNTFIPVPPIEEQKKIADFLDDKCEEVDKTISDLENMIKNLKEYKKSLIYEYTTGKQEVK